MRQYALLIALLPVLVIGACGGDDSPRSSGAELTDEQYLAAICSGTSRFAEALVTKTRAEDIGDVIKQFSAELKALNPPADLKSYTAQFTKYLDDAVSDPTSLVTRTPPLPSSDVRSRLAGKEATVAECKDGTFFSRGQ